jgi:signal transduction histidine kinase
MDEKSGEQTDRIVSEVLEVVEPPLTSLQTTFQNSLIIAGSAAILAGLLVVSVFTRQSLKPVRDLTNAAKKIGSGDFSHRVEAESDDEIGTLSKTFNSMITELESLQKERREMTAHIAHELRTPLTNIRGYLEGIKDQVIKPDKSTINIVHGQTIHLTKLVEDLRTLSMAEAESLDLDIKPGDLAGLIESSINDFSPRANKDGVKIHSDVQNDINMEHVSFDETRMKQIIANLIENALSYSNSGDEITIEMSNSKPHTVEINVIDNGSGIPELELNKIFDQFFRVDKSRSRKTGGAGLGLTIVKKLVEAHGGTISVESKLGVGTKFRISLPRNIQ